MKKYILLLFSVLSTTLLAGDSSWKLEKDKEGIKIFNRSLEGSKLKEYKGETTINASVNQLVALFKDINKHDKIFYKCKKGSVKLQKKVSDNEFYTYMVIEVPWPATNRDVVTKYVFNKPETNGAVTIELNAEKNMIPEVKGLVRVPSMKGYWKFIPLPNGQTKVIHQAYSSPGGNVPEALANNASVDAPYTMLKALKDMY